MIIIQHAERERERGREGEAGKENLFSRNFVVISNELKRIMRNMILFA